jgi:hypothetical protein
MTDATTSSASSNSTIAEDIVRLVPEYARPAFLDLLQTELRGRENLTESQRRRVAEGVWLKVIRHGLANKSGLANAKPRYCSQRLLYGS